MCLCMLGPLFFLRPPAPFCQILWCNGLSQILFFPICFKKGFLFYLTSQTFHTSSWLKLVLSKRTPLPYFSKQKVGDSKHGQAYQTNSSLQTNFNSGVFLLLLVSFTAIIKAEVLLRFYVLYFILCTTYFLSWSLGFSCFNSYSQ